MKTMCSLAPTHNPSVKGTSTSELRALAANVIPLMGIRCCSCVVCISTAGEALVVRSRRKSLAIPRTNSRPRLSVSPGTRAGCRASSTPVLFSHLGW